MQHSRLFYCRFQRLKTFKTLQIQMIAIAVRFNIFSIALFYPYRNHIAMCLYLFAQTVSIMLVNLNDKQNQFVE